MHLKLRIQYSGTNFSGSQLQAGQRTVQGELESAIARLAEMPVRVALAGRTDSGVHAWGQVASLTFPQRPRLTSPAVVMRALNALLPDDLSIAHAEVAPEGFHARFSARQRAYRYLFWSAPYPSPIMAHYTLHTGNTLKWDAMSEAAQRLEGTHDFAAFAGSGMGVPNSDGADTAGPSTVRDMHTARISPLPTHANPWLWSLPENGPAHKESEGTLFALDLIANAFLPQMVRNIVGTLLEIGRGKRTVNDINAILESRDRRTAGPTAKPHGLCLLWVKY